MKRGRKKVEINPLHSENILYLIASNGMTQVEFARKIGVSKQAINNIINGKNNISKILAAKICLVFPEYKINWLLGAEEMKKTLNNKQIGTEFEREMCQWLKDDGWWVHFISPDNRGAQPFDIIAVKDGIAIAADCKTCKNHFFRMDRLEDNQWMSFDKWKACGNSEPLIFVKHNNAVYCIEYQEFDDYEKIDLRKRTPMCTLGKEEDKDVF